MLLTAYYLSMTGHYPHTEELGNEIEGQREDGAINKSKKAFPAESTADVGQRRPGFMEQTVF